VFHDKKVYAFIIQRKENGCEFAGHEFVNTELNTVSFFYKPYHAWEKGTVKNINGLILNHSKCLILELLMKLLVMKSFHLLVEATLPYIQHLNL